MGGFYLFEGHDLNGTGLNVQLFHMCKALNQGFWNPNMRSWWIIVQAAILQLGGTISFRAVMLV